jgi:hypothetical protein
VRKRFSPAPLAGSATDSCITVATPGFSRVKRSKKLWGFSPGRLLSLANHKSHMTRLDAPISLDQHF